MSTTINFQLYKMYERFTEPARRVMQEANQEAQRFNHEYIGTEHILLGLTTVNAGVAATVLQKLNADVTKIRLATEAVLTAGQNGEMVGKLPQTSRGKKVIEYAMDEARNMQLSYVDIEHILLGLLREQEGVAANTLRNFGLTTENVRDEVIDILFPAKVQQHTIKGTRNECLTAMENWLNANISTCTLIPGLGPIVLSDGNDHSITIFYNQMKTA